MQDTSAKITLPEEDLSAILQDEAQAAIGMDWNDDTLSAERKRSLEYFKGEMNDLPSLANRSKAIDTTGADTIETILPDLMAIFTEEDIVEFEPQGDEDVDAARQETDFIRHILFNENRGWLHLYTAFKDALTVKMGVWHYWAEICEESDENTFQTQNEAEAIAAVYQAEMQGAELADYEVDREAQIIKLTFISETKELKVCFKAVAPEDVWFSDDGTTMRECTYVGMRARVREQDLIEDGFDEDKVKQLQTYSTDEDETRLARDTVNESEEGGDRGGMNGLRKVEVQSHYINTDLDGDGIKCWKIVTGDACKPILDIEQVSGIPFASITPFINPHRLIGQSMMDKTMEIQKIKTSLLRMMLDSGYFALNQRHEIVESRANANTVNDYLNNQPGHPVRVDQPDAVKQISSPGLGFDAANALEYMATQNEMRSGVIRNNMGLNGDALHETASGQRSQENMGQRRTRMIARSFAETGFRDLCLGVHGLLRDSAIGPMRKRINGETVEVDPSSWGVRKDMTIEIGSGGKDASRQAVLEVLSLLEKVVALQGSLEGPVIDVTGAHRVLTKYVDLLPVKGLSGLFIEPEQAQMQMAQDAQEPDPEIEAKQSELMMKAGLEQQKIQTDQQTDLARIAAEQETGLQRAVIEAQTKANLPDLRPGGDVGR
jgi:hypothetical protein